VLDTNEADLPARFYIRRIEHARTGAASALQWSDARF
jgi:hypothetical protein